MGLELYCRRGDRVFRVHQGTTLAGGDMIRFVPRIKGKGPHFGMVAVDRTGEVSRYFPVDGAIRREWKLSGAVEPVAAIPLDLAQTGVLFFKEGAP